MLASINKSIPALALAAAFSTPLAAADLIVNVSTVEKERGTVMVAVYDSKSSFQKTTAHATALPASSGEMQFTFSDIAPGDYAVLVFHDVNDNGDLDSNMLGMPKEPWGASVQGKSLFGAPDWAKTRFSLGDDGKSIKIVLN